MAHAFLPVLPRIQLEICIASVEDAVAAQAGDADRLELNSALALGGLTPSLGLLAEVRAATSLPLIAMLRPRPGGFCYSPAEFAVMWRDLDAAITSGADGIAFGILRADCTVDLDRCRQFVEQAGGREVVFHRAFDFVPDPLAALRQLAELGIRRVMTSGRKETALAGAEQIQAFVNQSGESMILPAGKIDAACCHELLGRTGCRQIHAALRMEATESNGSPNGMGTHEKTNPRAVRELRAALDAWQATQPE